MTYQINRELLPEKLSSEKRNQIIKDIQTFIANIPTPPRIPTCPTCDTPTSRMHGTIYCNDLWCGWNHVYDDEMQKKGLLD